VTAILKIALTGGIATGKSHVLARLAAAGVPTIDADVLVHRALGAGSPVIPPIVARFGPAVLDARGGVDRQVLGDVVFSAPAARADLESILHPQVYRLIDDWFASLGHDNPNVRGSESPKVDQAPVEPAFAVADIPLLFETGHERLFDRVIVTTCPRGLQLQRLQERNGLTERQARQRLEAQWPIEEKARRADYLIDTSGSFGKTDRQVDEMIECLRRERKMRK
jgi:dephospho-CoA kinase